MYVGYLDWRAGFLLCPRHLPVQAEVVGSRKGDIFDSHSLVYSLKVIPRSGSGKQLLGERLGWRV